MPFNWRDVSRREYDFQAEVAQGENCTATVRLIVRTQEKERPYLVRAQVDCVGKEPWVYEKPYRRLPSAMAAYAVVKEQAERRLRDN